MSILWKMQWATAGSQNHFHGSPEHSSWAHPEISPDVKDREGTVPETHMQCGAALWERH